LILFILFWTQESNDEGGRKMDELSSGVTQSLKAINLLQDKKK
jgi:hypothetical protein